MSAETDLLQEIRDHRTYALTEWEDIRGEAKKDKLCVAGKPWDALDPEGAKQRREAKRPMLALDELGQYENQTVNQVRANPRGIRYAPTGNGANDDGAEFYANHVREIEYRSHARIGYATAFQNAIESGYGWIRIRTKRVHMRTFDQDLYIDPVVNPDQILADPSAVWPDSRDMKWLYYIEPWSRADFKRRWPKSKAASFTLDTSRIAPGWMQRHQLDVAEYWRLETVQRRLVAFRRAKSRVIETALVDELPGGRLPAGVENLREEEVEDTKVRTYLTNGLEVLEEPKWAGKYIPFVSCYGKILYVDEGSGSKRQILSMTRLARDPYMLYCYMATCEAEAVGGIPRASWVGYEGQFAKPDRWTKANHEPVAFLEAKPSVPGNPMQGPLPLPRKEPWDPPLQNLEIAKEAARRAIQSAMGVSPLPTALQRENQKSGKAMERLDASASRGSFHFVDHYDLMIERGGVILEDLMDKVLDTARDVAVRKHDESSTIVRINDPKDPKAIFTKGDYRVTVSTGPASDSQREDAAGFVEGLVTNINVIAQLAGPLRALKLFAKSVKLKQLGPIGDEIIELLDPPELGKDGKPVPPQVAQLLGENQQLKQLLQRAAQEKEAKVVEQQGKFSIEKMKVDATSADKAADREVKLAVAELGARLDRLALFLEESQLVGARHAAAADWRTIRSSPSKDRVHERFSARRRTSRRLSWRTRRRPRRPSRRPARERSPRGHRAADRDAPQGDDYDARRQRHRADPAQRYTGAFIGHAQDGVVRQIEIPNPAGWCDDALDIRDRDAHSGLQDVATK
jgi:hypothetical protein